MCLIFKCGVCRVCNMHMHSTYYFFQMNECINQHDCIQTKAKKNIISYTKPFMHYIRSHDESQYDYY